MICNIPTQNKTTLIFWPNTPVTFWVFTAVSTPVFWVVKPYSLADSTNAPRKPAIASFSNPDRGRRDTGLEAVRIQVFLCYLTNNGRMKSPQILPNQTHHG
jgi:hypothetical protein